MPPGSFHLKHFRLQDPSTSLARLRQTQEATKLEAIRPLVNAYPKRRFILIGDSGEQDPEIYAMIAKERGAQVVAIFIRNVTREDMQNVRFQTLQRELAGVPLVLFDGPDQIRPAIDEILH